MKKILALLFVFAALGVRAEPGTDWTKFQNCALYSCNSGIVQQFGVQDWYWAGQVDDEPILPIVYGQIYHLWRPATNIVKVVQYATGRTFTQGVDYLLTADGEFEIPSGSSIPLAPQGFTTTPDPNSPYLSQSKTKEGGGLYLGTNYALYQIAVTYATTTTTPPEPAHLPNFWSKIAAHTPVAVTWFGDSITQGGNSSASLNNAPQMPGFVQLVDAYMSQVAPGYVYYRNVSLSGLSSAGALQYVQQDINDTPSDLVVIGFGMNDASGNVDKATYKANIKAIIDDIRAYNSDTEILLLSGTTSNPDWINDHPRFHEYRDALHELAGNYTGVAVVDVTAAWESALQNHSYYDLTANGVNHPGDFGHKLYAQTLIQALFGSDPQ